MNKITAAVVLAFAAMGAQADSVSYSASTAMALTDWGSGAGSSAVNLSVAQFDSSLGTLNSVVLTLANNTDAQFVFTNNGGSNFTFHTNSPYNHRADVVSTVWLDGLGALSGQTLVATTGTFSTPGLNNLTVNSGSSYNSGLQSFSATNSSSYTDAGTLSAFTGGGTISFSASSVASSAYIGSSNVVFNPQSWAQAGLTVTYNYSTHAVPEPGMVALAGVAALGLLASRRRNRV